MHFNTIYKKMFALGCAAAVWSGIICTSSEAYAYPIEDAMQGSFLWTDFFNFSAKKSSEASIWKSDHKIVVNNLYIGMSAEDLKILMKDKNLRTVEDETCVYDDNVVVRINKGRIVNISSAGTPECSISQSGKSFVKIGDSIEQCLESLGDPSVYYSSEEKGIRIALYSHQSCDVGIFFQNGFAAGFLLTEPGMLAESLKWSGYKLEN